LAIFNLKKVKLRWITNVLVIVGLTVLFFFAFQGIRAIKYELLDVRQRVLFGSNESLSSINERLDFWKGAIFLTKEKPLLGWGPFSFRYAYNQIQDDFLASSDHPHNIFLKISAENGVPAAAFFLFFVVTFFYMLLRGYGRLSEEKRRMVIILSIAILGALAHNLIDYNFNFTANILLFFLYLIFLRSIVGGVVQNKKGYAVLVVAFMIAVLSFFEGMVFLGSKAIDEDLLKYSYFPRSYYILEAKEAIVSQKYQDVYYVADRQLELNPLDSNAWYYKGLACEAMRNEENCIAYFDNALGINPNNEIIYYFDYLHALKKSDKNEREFEDFIERSKELVTQYFDHVQNNVHFTAYSTNVEAAYLLVEELMPYLSDEEKVFFVNKREDMMEKANSLRDEQLFI
jgi:tetratricopeptide (TPR) repeat protein